MAQGAVSIVVVDDDADVADMLAVELRDAGYRVEVAHSAEAAVLSVERLQSRCVLLDIGMPGIDGGDVAECLRHRFKHTVTLIAVTGLAPDSARARHTALIVDHYFEKPVDIAALLAILPPARMADTAQ